MEKYQLNLNMLSCFAYFSCTTQLPILHTFDVLTCLVLERCPRRGITYTSTQQTHEAALERCPRRGVTYTRPQQTWGSSREVPMQRRHLHASTADTRQLSRGAQEEASPTHVHSGHEAALERCPGKGVTYTRPQQTRGSSREVPTQMRHIHTSIADTRQLKIQTPQLPCTMTSEVIYLQKLKIKKIKNLPDWYKLRITNWSSKNLQPQRVSESNSLAINLYRATMQLIKIVCPELISRTTHRARPVNRSPHFF